jgi:glycosyltransferase involved in cell wall biosynthesis
VALAEQWTREGVRVDFVADSRDQLIGSVLGEGSLISVNAPKFSDRQSPLMFGLELALAHWVQWPRLRGILKRMESTRTVLVTSTPFPGDLLVAFRASKNLRIPAAVHFHHVGRGPSWHPTRRGGFARVSIAWALSTFALLLCKIGDLLPIINHKADIEVAGWKFRAVLEDGQFVPAEIPAPPRVEGRTIEACFVGRIAPSKGVEDLIRAWRLVRSTHPSATLAIAGTFYSEDYRRRILRLISKLELDRGIVIKGYISEAEKTSLLETSKVFLFPSYEEGWSLSVMEAAVHGAVPVVYNLPAYDYLGPKILRIPPGDVQRLGRVTSDLLNSPETRLEIQSDVALRVSRFTQEATARAELAKLEDWRKTRLATVPAEVRSDLELSRH